ncbi:Farnesol dehydrogenase [Blattella germanica]|nr:Farnesol dehydrogenase [Blattella germanica]
MERWVGKVAVVTGASSGIGAAVAKELVKKGLKVVGLARRTERLQELEESLKCEKGEFHGITCDVTKETQVTEAFEFVNQELGGVDILVNNAGLGNKNTLRDGPVDYWKSILDLNILALSVCTREALQSMKQRGVDTGHIIHINSISGHKLPEGKGYMYSAAKHAVTVLAEGLRVELKNEKSKIRVTSISPGWVKTEILNASFPSNLIEEHWEKVPTMDVQDVVDAVIYVLGTRPNVQVEEILLTAIYNEPLTN